MIRSAIEWLVELVAFALVAASIVTIIVLADLVYWGS